MNYIWSIVIEILCEVKGAENCLKFIQRQSTNEIKLEVFNNVNTQRRNVMPFTEEEMKQKSRTKTSGMHSYELSTHTDSTELGRKKCENCE